MVDGALAEATPPCFQAPLHVSLSSCTFLLMTIPTDFLLTFAIVMLFYWLQRPRRIPSGRLSSADVATCFRARQRPR